MPNVKIGLPKIKQIIEEEIKKIHENEEVDSDKVIKVLQLLKPFEDAIKKFESAEKTAALTNAFTPIVSQLKSTIMTIRTSADTYALDVKPRQPLKMTFKPEKNPEKD